MAQNGQIDDVLVAGTADRNGRLIHNEDYRGGHFIVVASSIAGAVVSAVVTIEGLVPGTTGTFYTILASSALAAEATFVLKVYPGMSTAGAGSNIASDVLPEWFRVRTTSGTTGAINLSVGANLVL